MKINRIINNFQYICFVNLHKYVIEITVKATNQLMDYETNLNQSYFNNLKGLK